MDQEENALPSSLVQLFLQAPALQGVSHYRLHASKVKEMLLTTFYLPSPTFFDTVAKISILSK